MEQQISSEDRSAIEALVSQTLNDLSQVSASAASYENAAVSASAAVGPEGAGMQGWITYTRTGEKIFCNVVKVTSSYGLFAGFGLSPLHGALRAELIAGQTGTFTVEGWGIEGQLQMRVKGTPVLSQPLKLAGAGIGKWEIKGELTFLRAT